MRFGVALCAPLVLRWCFCLVLAACGKEDGGGAPGMASNFPGDYVGFEAWPDVAGSPLSKLRGGWPSVSETRSIINMGREVYSLDRRKRLIGAIEFIGVDREMWSQKETEFRRLCDDSGREMWDIYREFLQAVDAIGALGLSIERTHSEIVKSIPPFRQRVGAVHKRFLLAANDLVVPADSADDELLTRVMMTDK